MKKKLVKILLMIIILVPFISINKASAVTSDSATENEIVKKFGEYFYNNFSEANCNVFLNDITNDGLTDMIVVDMSKIPIENKVNVYVYSYIKSKVKIVKTYSGYRDHAGGFFNLYILKIDGKLYLYQCEFGMWQGSGSLSYQIFSLSNDSKEKIYIQNEVKGDLISDVSYDRFMKEEKSYEEYLINTLYTSNGPYFSDNEYTVSKAGDVFKNYYKLPADIIQWKDPVIESNIRKALGKLKGFIKKADLAKVTKISISNEKIVSLENLAGCTNLTVLSLNNCQITDIGYLKGMKKLKALDLSYNQIDDLNILKSFSNLEELYLYGCWLNDVNVLKYLKKLTNINLDHNNLEDISALSGLTNLTDLSLHACNISSIKDLGKLIKLKTLDLGGNSIKDVSSIKALVNLNKLYLDFNKITNINVLKYLTKLTYIDLSSNQITDISSLKKLSKLTYVNLDFNQIKDWEPVKHVKTVQGR